MVWRGIKEAVKAVALILFVLLIAGAGRPTEAQTSTDQTAARLLERIEKLEQSLAAAARFGGSAGRQAHGEGRSKCWICFISD